MGVSKPDASLSADIAAALCRLAVDLASSVPAAERYERLLSLVQSLVPCDAVTLLRVEGGHLRPLAAHGLRAQVMERSFRLADEPRLAAIAAHPGPVRFPAQDPRPDPFDGLFEDSVSLSTEVHSCMGCALRLDGEMVGILAIDAAAPGRFDHLELSQFSAFAAMAAASIRTAALLESLEARSERSALVARHLSAEALRSRGGGLIGESPVMARLRAEIDDVAGVDLPVLILGETGVGKELVARLIHTLSSRSAEALVHVNCAALPEAVAESELFGHQKGAFTGAVSDRLGRFELADQGILFLDEIGELSPSLQAKLLRAVQFGEIQRLGADETLRVDVRCLAATNRDLPVEIRDGRFREDLYHRLSVFPIRVPPLRERRGDVPLLTTFFLDQARLRLGLGPIEATPRALAALEAYRWPGNVRELDHVLIRAALRAAGRRRRESVEVDVVHLDLDGPRALPARSIDADATPPGGGVPLDGRPFSEHVVSFERDLIERALEAAAGNWSHAARLLGVDRSNLHRLGRRLGLKSES